MLRGLHAATNAHSADWMVQGVRDFDCTVGSLVPAVFEGYARVFHPASCGPHGQTVEVRWSDVAAANNRVMHPAVEWGSLTGSWQMQQQADLWDRKPGVGRLSERLAERLSETLALHTRTPDRCNFGVWEGSGKPMSLIFLFKQGTPEEAQRRAHEHADAQIDAWRTLLDQAPKFSLPDRKMHLLEGPLDSIREFYERYRDPPSIWWPADRAWCAATDIDLMTTYVGGSGAAISALLDDEQIEALRVTADQSVTWEADTINPLPPAPG